MNRNGRIEIGGAGTGEVGDVEIGRRARQLAQSDGRSTANELDMQQARQQLLQSGTEESPEEMIAESERPDAGVAASSPGRQITPVSEDTNIGEELVREGLEEADFDTRFRAGEQT